MKIEYEITIKDYIEYSKIVQETNLKDHGFYGTFALAFGICIAMFIIFFRPFGGPDLRAYFWGFLFAYIILHLMSKYYSKAATRKLYPLKDGSILGNKTVALEDDNFSVETGNSKDIVDYTAVKKMLETDRYFFIMLDSILGFTVPKRSFKNPDQIDNFKSTFEIKSNLKIEKVLT